MRELAHDVSFAGDLMPERFGLCPKFKQELKALLAAGMTTGAANFIHDERGIETFGNSPGRTLARLHADLRLFFAHGAK
ncbi:hypothetical protein ABIC09_007301 [Bradyrhizobium sp. S3.12.5]|uniref:hypothetical protein n=1 Tax=Bradyrhizobium sp. S3.12.5 TaxID=3156386 RepID=UPI003392A006